MKQTKQYLELSKDISLRQFFPDKLLALRKNKTCDVVLPEWLFDMDYPGLYLRQIKSVKVSVQCTAAPGTTVSCKLSLRNSKYRLYPTLEFAAYTHEAHYKHLWQPVDAIATSNAQDDDGFFNCKFHDENYKPFDKAGAMGKWRIELPAVYAQFDYDTITDIVLHIDYTAIDEGFLKDVASRYVQDALAGLNNAGDGFMQLLDIKADFATALTTYATGFTTDNTTGLKLALTPQGFPYFTHNRQITISGLEVGIVPGNTLQAGSKLHIHYKQGSSIYELVVDVDTLADKTVSPAIVIKGNTKLLKLVLKNASGQPLNIDTSLKSLYVIARCKCSKDLFTTADANDVDTWDGDVIAEPQQLMAPALTATEMDNKVRLDWTAVDHASGYRLEQLINGSYTEIYTGTARTLDVNETNGTKVYFRVKALGEGAYADSVFSYKDATPQIASNDGPPITNLAAWWKADAGVTVSGGSVTSWVDQSVNGRELTTYSDSGSPTRIDNTIAGKPVVDFNGSQVLSTAAFFGVTDNITVFAVHKNHYTTAGYWGAAISVGWGFNEKDIELFGRVSLEGNAYNSVTIHGGNIFNSTNNPEGYHLDCFVSEHNVRKLLRIDSTNTHSMTAGLGYTEGDALPLRIGGGINAGNYVGQIAEILIYNKAMTTTEIEAVESYLKAKYDLN